MFSSPSKGKTSKTTGNAGARLACGIVGKVKTIAHVLFFSFLFFSSKRPSRIVETRRDSPKNLDSRSSRRERKSDSSETSLHARYLLCKTHRSRNTARNKLYKHTVRNRRGVLSPFVSCETTSHDSKTSPRSGQKGKRNELESNRPSTHVASSDCGRHARVVDRTVGVLDVDAFGVVVGATRASRPACASSAASSSSATRK